MFECSLLPSQEELRKFYYYSSGKLFHTHRQISKGRWSIKGGREVSSSLDASGYKRLVFNKKTYPVHRFIWQIVYGDLEPTATIDHIDRDKTNNLISNLRKVSLKEQSKNKSKPKNNTSGFVGVCRNRKHYPKGGAGFIDYYVARWYDETGTLRGKHFRIDLYGEDIAYEMAVEYRRRKLRELSYAENHGE